MESYYYYSQLPSEEQETMERLVRETLQQHGPLGIGTILGQVKWRGEGRLPTWENWVLNDAIYGALEHACHRVGEQQWHIKTSWECWHQKLLRVTQEYVAALPRSENAAISALLAVAKKAAIAAVVPAIKAEMKGQHGIREIVLSTKETLAKLEV